MDALSRRRLGIELARAAVAAVDARRCTEDALARLGRDGVALTEPCVVLAFGKCALGMVAGALARVRVARGIAIVPDGQAPPPSAFAPLAIRAGGHPLPRSDAARTGEEVLALARSLGPEDVVLCLVSGGGSAMLELPVDGVDIEAIATVTRTLSRAGATIAELNAVRQRLSRLKGGKLARAMNGARVVNVVISDVPGGSPALVASGPTVVAESTLGAREVLERYALRDVPSTVLDALARDEGVPLDSVGPITTIIAADNETARRGVVATARERGLALVDLPGFFAGEARDLGARLATEAHARLADPNVDGVVWGGETTVTVAGHGRGGRNQEVALGALSAIGPHLLVAVGTDGIDGSSDAAGAFVDADVRARAAALSLDAGDALGRNDADAFLRAVDARIVTGPTGTNVADIALVLR